MYIAVHITRGGPYYTIYVFLSSMYFTQYAILPTNSKKCVIWTTFSNLKINSIHLLVNVYGDFSYIKNQSERVLIVTRVTRNSNIEMNS